MKKDTEIIEKIKKDIISDNDNIIQRYRNLTILLIGILIVISAGMIHIKINNEHAICERIILDSSFGGKNKSELNKEELKLLKLKTKTCFNGR